jgi:hypothetical protein
LGAGGAIMRDLFEQDDGGWLRDVPLLDRLVTEKLKAEAEILAAGRSISPMAIPTTCASWTECRLS